MAGGGPRSCQANFFGFGENSGLNLVGLVKCSGGSPDLLTLFLDNQMNSDS